MAILGCDDNCWRGCVSLFVETLREKLSGRPGTSGLALSEVSTCHPSKECEMCGKRSLGVRALRARTRRLPVL